MQYSDDEDEGKDGYKVGGYHAVKVRRVSRLRRAPESSMRMPRGSNLSFACVLWESVVVVR